MWNSKGAVAEIEDDDMNSIEIALNKDRQNPKAICTEAARRLRKLADDFDRLALMEEPFKAKTQLAAAKVAS